MWWWLCRCRIRTLWRYSATSSGPNGWRRGGKFMVGTHNTRSGCFTRSWISIFGACGSEFTIASWAEPWIDSTSLSYLMQSRSSVINLFVLHTLFVGCRALLLAVSSSADHLCLVWHVLL